MSYGAWIYDVGGWLWKEVGGGWEREGLRSWSLVDEYKWIWYQHSPLLFMMYTITYDHALKCAKDV